MRKWVCLALCLLCVSPHSGVWAQARTQESALPPALEVRARALFREIRCPVCEYQSIADSPAELAQDLRAFVRAELANGLSDAEIRAQLRARYGDYMLFRPSLTPRNWLLWLTPLLGLALLLWLAWRMVRARR